jgi:hypothetical protein
MRPQIELSRLVSNKSSATFAESPGLILWVLKKSYRTRQFRLAEQERALH